MERLRPLLAAAVFLLLVFGAASTGAFVRPGAWYASLVKPSWNPPAWLFGPVWTTLYLMIAAAGWLVWRRGALGRTALVFWGLQIALNASWTLLFFGLHRPLWALFDIAALWLSILAFVWTAWPASRAAALLFVPYLLWVGFATALNAALWRLNP